jgi:tRNA-dihydrouridine synthase
MLAMSGADGVMIGRGAYGRPWFPGHLARFAATGVMPAARNGEALLALIEDHYAAMLSHYGERIGLRAARKHLGWYLDQVASPVEVRTAAMTGTDPGVVMDAVAAAFAAAQRRAA